MIRSTRQLSRAKERLDELSSQLLEIKEQYTGIEEEIFAAPLIHNIMELEEDIVEFESLKSEGFDEAVQGRLKTPAMLENIGELLTKLRIASGLTQVEMAERLGWQQPNLARFEVGNAHSQTLVKIAEYADSLDVWLYVVPELGELEKGVRYEAIKESLTWADFSLSKPTSGWDEKTKELFNKQIMGHHLNISIRTIENLAEPVVAGTQASLVASRTSSLLDEPDLNLFSESEMTTV